MSDRSILRVRTRPHIHPDRQEEVWEVLRDGEVVATIYGSREGVHIVSDRIIANGPFRFQVGEIPSLVVPLLRDDEPCPWCAGQGTIPLCPVCEGRKPPQEERCS